MKQIKLFSKIALCLSGLLFAGQVEAGNPDRQGESGAYELLINPWARSAGLNGLVTASVSGVESMRFNPAGLGQGIRDRSTEIAVSHAQYLVGTGLSLNAAGISQKIGNNGAIGLSLMALSFGDIALTTTNQPEGIGTFSPTFFNIGIGYGHVFRDNNGREKVYVGATMRVASESISNVSATGVCFDAGIQYVTGKHRQFKIGLALRNIGSKMRFKGDGLSFVGVAPNGTTALATEQRTAGFEMPSLLHIGASYDFLFPEPTVVTDEDEDAEDMETTEEETDEDAPEALPGRIVATNRVTVFGNFTANSFSRDEFGLGLEYAFREMFMFRLGYKYEGAMYNPALNTTSSSGLAGGVSIEIPFQKNSNQRIAFDYAYHYTRVFKGTHTVGVKVSL